MSRPFWREHTSLPPAWASVWLEQADWWIGSTSPPRHVRALWFDSVRRCRRPPNRSTSPRSGISVPLLSQQPAGGIAVELGRQNRDLLQTLEVLRERESELEKRQEDLSRLNAKLEETNRGVLALYAELDEKATALRRADEMKSRFLSHVSHEFRTPVNAMLALTRLLLRRVDGELSPEQEKQVAYIRDAAQQLAEMVNDLLDLAKVDSGKAELRIATIDAGQFLGAIRGLMRPLATNEAVSLVFEEPPEALLFQSDESKLGQILRNLISNALKFTLEGEVKISAGISATGDFVLFTVKDTGIGIALENQERVFHEFTQIEHPVQKQVKGTGLGLFLSRRLADLLGATLEVESSLGIGSTFKLTMPYSAPLSKLTGSRHEGPMAIREVLGEPSLVSPEPEFLNRVTK